MCLAPSRWCVVFLLDWSCCSDLCVCFLSDRGWWLPSQIAARAMSSSTPSPAASGSSYTTLAVTQPAQFITHVEINRPEKLNAMSRAFWR